MKRLRCPDEKCRSRTNSSLPIIIRFGFYQTRWGKRRRFRCKGCGRTFCRNSGTVYHRLQHRRVMFDQVAALSVEGVNKSAIARVQQIAWNTADRWLEKAAAACRLFNHQRITNIQIRELQADEICAMVGGKDQPSVWIFAAIEVWSRLWPSTVVGKRSYRNTLTLFRDVCARNIGNKVPLIATDGFKFYRQVVRRLFGAACLYGQVIKERRNDRVVKVQRKASFGAAWRWDEVWRNSEDSRQLNTSYIERLNLTIRQGSAYLCRRTLCHARRKQRLEDHLDLLRCHYNFLRPHRALKFGRQVRTPAMQAGLTKQPLTFRDIFTSIPKFLRLARSVCVFIFQTKSTRSNYSAISIAA
jgi:transposase-like protein/IS1 family transposase